jgi:hypothetical protein
VFTSVVDLKAAINRFVEENAASFSTGARPNKGIELTAFNSPRCACRKSDSYVLVSSPPTRAGAPRCVRSAEPGHIVRSQSLESKTPQANY